MEAKNLGELIFKLRTKKGLTQLELGNFLNVSDKTVSKWESGKGFPEVTQLPEIARFFNVSLDFLMTGEKPNSKPILMSKIEYCAKTDDPKLAKDIKLDVRDEDGHGLMHYIKKYESLNVLNYLFDKEKGDIVAKGMSDEEIVYFAIILNRLDIIKFKFRFNVAQCESVIRQLRPSNAYAQYEGRVFTDRIFKTIVTDKRINSETIDYLLAPTYENNDKDNYNYWTQAFPYIIDAACKYKNKNLLERLLTLIEKDNADKFVIYQKSLEKVNRRSVCLNYDRAQFAFGGNTSNSVYTQYCTVTRILESTIKAALSQQDYLLVDRLNKINDLVIKMDFKCFVASEYDIRMTKVLNDPKATEAEKKKQSVIFNGKVDLKKIIALGDFEIYKELKNSLSIEPHSMTFGEIKDFEDIRFFKEALKTSAKNSQERELNCDSEIHGILKYVLVNYPERYDIQQFLLDNGAQLVSHWTEDDGWGYNISRSSTEIIATQLLKNQLKILNKK